MGTSLLLWVTSKCNLTCPLCAVQYIQKYLPDYEMSLEEVKNIITSSKARGIHYSMIHYAGGEPTVWTHLEEATKLFYESGITDNITLISNGTNPEKIFSINHMLSCYAISATQISAKQLALFTNTNHKIIYNHFKHVNLPTVSLLDTLPAICCNRMDYLGANTNQLHYVNGIVFYCCYALVLSEKACLTPDLFCNFEEDFLLKFSDKTYNKTICTYCICNNNVLEKII